MASASSRLDEEILYLIDLIDKHPITNKNEADKLVKLSRDIYDLIIQMDGCDIVVSNISHMINLLEEKRPYISAQIDSCQARRCYYDLLDELGDIGCWWSINRKKLEILQNRTLEYGLEELQMQALEYGLEELQMQETIVGNPASANCR